MTNQPWHQNVLVFWFEELTKKEWFMSSTAIDKSIAERFFSTHQQVSNTRDLPKNSDLNQALASVIVLDQFSRNMFRGTKNAFAYDSLSLHLSKQAIEKNLDESMTNEQKQFLYMPLMHSENGDDQQKSLVYFDALGLSEHAIEHAQLIERFGRFPHRNAVLGRQSTSDELAYLEDGKRFGQ